VTAAQLVNRLLEADDIDWSPRPDDPDFDGSKFLDRHPDIQTLLPTKEQVEFTLECEPEHQDFRGHFDSGEPELDRQNEEWIERQLNLGNQWAWCSVKVTAKWTDAAGQEFEGYDYLGGCSYHNKRDFIAGGYYEQMQDEAYARLIKEIKYAKWPGWGGKTD